MNGSQIRSISARLICDDVATSDHRHGGAREQHGHPVGAAAHLPQPGQPEGDAGAQDRSGGEQQGTPGWPRSSSHRAGPRRCPS